MRRRSLSIKWVLGEPLPAHYKGTHFSTPKQVVAYCTPLLQEYGEVLWVLLLDARHRLLGHREVSRGTLNGTVADPRAIFTPALLAGASAIVLVHNHPSGDPTPSPEDMEVSKLAAQAGKLLNIQVLDHVVLAGVGDKLRGPAWISIREIGGLE